LVVTVKCSAGCFLFAPIQLIYVAVNWKQTTSAFFLQVAGLIGVGVYHALAK